MKGVVTQDEGNPGERQREEGPSILGGATGSLEGEKQEK